MATTPNEKDLMWRQLSYCGCNESPKIQPQRTHDRAPGTWHIRGARPHVDVAQCADGMFVIMCSISHVKVKAGRVRTCNLRKKQASCCD